MDSFFSLPVECHCVTLPPCYSSAPHDGPVGCFQGEQSCHEPLHVSPGEVTQPLRATPTRRSWDAAGADLMDAQTPVCLLDFQISSSLYIFCPFFIGLLAFFLTES